MTLGRRRGEISSIEEFRSKYFPDTVLERLEERLCSKIGLTEPHQHRLSKNEHDSNTGLLELAKPKQPHDSIIEVMAEFYKTEGFEVHVYAPHMMGMTKGIHKYICSVNQDNSTYEVYIFKDPHSYLKK